MTKSQIEYYKIDDNFIAVDHAQHDRTGFFVVGRSGPIDKITEQVFEIRRLPPPTPAILVPVAWQRAFGLAPVVEAVKPVYYEAPTPPPMNWNIPIRLPQAEPEENPLIGACISVVCIIILAVLYLTT